VAADGESGITAFQQHQDRIRVVLLDVQLPGRFGGAETLEQLCALDPHVPVILCTGFVREDELARMRQLDVEDVMLKPVDVNALLARLEVLATAGR
jgi:CheY-like chemotaxis protein